MEILVWNCRKISPVGEVASPIFSVIWEMFSSMVIVRKCLLGQWTVTFKNLLIQQNFKLNTVFASFVWNVFNENKVSITQKGIKLVEWLGMNTTGCFWLIVELMMLNNWSYDCPFTAFDLILPDILNFVKLEQKNR